MTEREVIKKLEQFQLQIEHSIAERECCEYDDTEKASQTDIKSLEAFDMAITALKEVQQYREIGTVEECREAVEKQKPKSLDHINGGITVCRYCGRKILRCYEFCPDCGQAIQWNENLEETEDER